MLHAAYPPRVSKTVDWPSARLDYAVMPPHRPDGLVTTSYPNQVGVSFTGHAKAVRDVDGRICEEDIRPGAALFTSAGPVTWLQVAEPSECIEIFPDPSIVRQVSDGAVRSLRDIVADRFVDDPVIVGIAMHAKKAAVGAALVNDVEADALTYRLVDHIVHTYTGRRRPDHEAPSGGLSPRRLRRVADYVEARLGERLTLAELATHAALSPFHFARAFRATVGVTPHDYVTARRLERARHLIITTDLPIERIAHLVSFRNIGHFRRKFREHHGASPIDVRTAYR